MFKIVDDEKNRVSEEELLGAIEENEEPRPVLPKYLTAIYGRIYENLKVSSFLDNPRLLKIFTLGNSSRLIDAALKEIKQSQKVLQIGATFGDQIEQTADRIGHYGKYDLIDISETQLAAKPLPHPYYHSVLNLL